MPQVLHESGCRHPVAATTGYQEPSLVFLAGTDTRFTDADGAADFLRGGSCRFAFIDAPQEREFALRAEAIGLRYDRRAAHRRLQHQRRQADQHCGIPIGRRAVNGPQPPSDDMAGDERRRRARGQRPLERLVAQCAEKS